MSVSVVDWWYLLCVMAAVNIVAWSLSAAAFCRWKNAATPQDCNLRRLQLLLSAVYVFGCAFRSAFPVYDVPRICLWNTGLSSVLLGRSVATVAELCFVGQWAAMLHQASRATHSVIGHVSSRLVVPLIAIAEICSWYSVLTTSNLGHIAEESIWALCAALMVASMVAMLPHCEGMVLRAFRIGCLIGMAYVVFMVLVDVPMYASRWIADEAGGHHYMSLAQGLFDARHRWTVSHRWQDWKNEVAWMTLYFSVAVWFSIWLTHAPRLYENSASDNRLKLGFFSPNLQATDIR